jgi:ABC-2 type transport system permease protein
VVGVLIRMKWRVLRHSLHGKQGALTVGGAVVGLLAAAVTVLVSTADFERPGVDVAVLAALYLLWTVGWLFGPVLTGGGDETLRPEHFALLPITPRRLAAGLLGAAFVGVPAIVTFLAFTGLVVAADGVAAAGVAIVVLPLQLVFVVLLSRVTMAGLGAVLRSRRGRDLGVLLAALVGLSGFAVQAALNTVAPLLVEGRSPTLATVLRAVPSGWGIVAVDAAGRGEWLLALGCVAGLAVLVAGLLAAWGVLLVRRTTRVAVNAGPRKARTRAGIGHRLPPTPIGAVASKELRTWARDARRRVALLSMLIVGVVVSVLPAVSGNDTGSLPFAGLVVVTMGCLLAGNLYGMDGSALWHTLVVPGGEAADVRGRQLAWLLIVGPVTLVLALVLPAATDPGTYPWVLGLAPALLGGGAGLIVVLSVYAGYPMPDQKGNPFAAGGNPGIMRALLQLGIALLLGVVALPEIAIAAFGAGTPAVQWLALPVGVAVGVGCWWWWGNLAQRRLAARGPELLAEVRRHV